MLSSRLLETSKSLEVMFAENFGSSENHELKSLLNLYAPIYTVLRSLLTAENDEIDTMEVDESKD